MPKFDLPGTSIQEDVDNSRASFDESLWVDPRNTLEKKEFGVQSLYEGLGQFVWGASEALSLGTLEFSDIAEEAVAEKKYQKGEISEEELKASRDRMEKAFTSIGGILPDSYEGDFGELGTLGQVGYTLGAILGTIPTFVVGGAITGKAITGVSKIGNAGTRLMRNKAGREIEEYFVKKATSNITESQGIKALGKQEFKEIAEKGFESISKDSFAHNMRTFGNEVFEETAKGEISNSIRSLTAMKDGDLLAGLSSEVFDIVTKNNPQQAQQILFGLGASAFKSSPKVGLIAGAMGYDAILGLTIGTMRGSASSAIHKNYGYQEPESYANKILSDALHEGAILSLIGPVKFIKGGSQQSILKNTKNTLFGMVKNLKPVTTMDKDALRTNIKFLNKLSKGEINKKISDKAGISRWNRNGWEKTADADDMRKFLNTARKDFVLNAPALWAREFGAEILYSLPRMAMGTVAMHSAGIFEMVKEHGVENIEHAFGATPEERISNIFTAMFFTRKPHSFHTSDKMMGFETGKIRDYASQKGDMLAQTIGGMRAMGLNNVNSMNRYLNEYGGKIEDLISANENSIRNYMLDSTPAIKEIKKIITTQDKLASKVGDQEKAHFDKAATEYMLDTFGERPSQNVNEKRAYRDKIVKAQAIMRFYRDLSFDGRDMEFNYYTQEQANTIVNKLSKIKFGERELSSTNPQKDLADWHMGNLKNTTIEPINKIQSFVANVYEAFGVIPIENNGVLEVPKVDFNFSGIEPLSKKLDVQNAFQSAVKDLESAKRLRQTREEKVDHESTTLESRQQAGKYYDETVDALHTWLYGKNWANDHSKDINIINHTAWYKSYDILNQKRQAEDTVALLTGDSKHTLDQAEYDKLRQEMMNILSGKKTADIEETTDTALESKEYTDVLSFTHKLHSLVGKISNSKRNDSVPISYNDAATLKTNFEKQLGDIISRPDAYKFLKRKLVDHSIDQLNLTNVQGDKHNVKSGILGLMNSEQFETKNGVTVIPDYITMGNHLNALKISGAEHRKELIGFYGEIIDAIEGSKFSLIKISKRVNESKEGDWLEALNNIRTDSISDFISRGQDRLKEIVDSAEVAGDHFKILAEEMYSMSKRSKDKDDALDKKIRELDRQGQSFQNLVNTVKAAHQGANRPFLHSLLSRDVEYKDLIDAITNAKTTDRASEYFVKLLELHERINNDSIKSGYTESLVSERVTDIMDATHVPDRDVASETIRVSTAQFALKYGMSGEDIGSILFMHRSPTIDAYRAKAVWKKLESESRLTMTPEGRRDLHKLIEATGDGELSPDAFRDVILKPLYLLATQNRDFQVAEGIKKAKSISDEDIKADIDAIVTAGTSSVPITEYQYLGGGRFVAGTKIMAHTRDRGVNGIIDRLADGTNAIVLLSNTNLSTDGKRVRNFPKYLKDDINGHLRDINVDYKIGLRDYVYKTKSVDTENFGNMMPHGKQNQFRMVELDESTAILVRVDPKSPLIDSILTQYKKGGEMFETIEAMKTTNGRISPILQDLLNRVHSNNLTDVDIANAVRITRILLDAPHIFDKASAGFTYGAYDMTDSKALDKLWKYLKTAEPKNGFIGSPQNLRRKHDTLKYLADESPDGGHYKQLYDYVKPWITPDKDGKYRKLKVLSIADEIERFHNNPDGRNIFDSQLRAEVFLKKHNPNLTDKEIKYNIELIGELRKSIVDGEFLMTENSYVSSLAMMAAANDRMITFDGNGNVKTIHAGGIKPSVNHVSVNRNRKSNNYGRARVFYAKTAFKHRPEFNQLLEALKVDAITFKSANKINEFKNNKGLDWTNSDIDEYNPNGSNTYASIKPVDVNTSEGIANIVEWLGKPGNLIYDGGDINNHISHIPFSSINMFSVGKGHKPMVSANLGVHMRDSNGIKDWIGLDQKLRQVNTTFTESHNNIYYSTKLAREMLGDSSNRGDMQFINTGLDYVMRYDGFITDKWMRESIDERIIPYLLNNGAIAGGRVDEGTYDVMSGDFSGYDKKGNNFLEFSIRKSIKQKDDILGGIFGGDRKVLTYFGEFLPSYEFVNMKYKPFGGEGGRADIGSVIVQRLPYAFNSEKTGKQRIADGYFIKDESGGDIFIIEGIGIDKDGNYRNLSYLNSKTDKKFTPKLDRKLNKGQFEMALERQKEIDALYEEGNTYGQMMYKVHEYRDANNIPHNELGIATINSRQPRNQMGDLIITRLKSFRDSQKIINVSHDQKSGNLSSMNFIDVIHAQDADFDMDKSMVFGSAPHKFWSEVGRLAGYETTADRDIISKMFLDEANSQTYERLWSDSAHKEAINNIDAARGRFVKMHQTMTYMANIFRGAEGEPTKDAKGTDVLTFLDKTIDPTKRLIVRVNDLNASYVNSTEYVSTVTKKFLDMYVNQPTRLLDNINEIQWQIYFGPNGLFKVGTKDTKTGEYRDLPNLTVNELSGPRDAIIQHFLQPINKYLRMNKGTAPDETGAEIKATIEDYHFTFRNLMYGLNKDFVKFRGDKKWKIDISDGLDKANIYFGVNSSNPYDFAMRSIYSIRGKLTGKGDESQSAVQNLISYIEYGFDKTRIDTKEQALFLNTIKQKAFTQLVRDDAKAIEFEDIVSRISYLDFELANMDKFDKTGSIRENRNYKVLQNKRDRAMEIKRELEEVLAYKRSPDEDIFKLKNPVGEEFNFLDEGKWHNRNDRPVVIRNKNGKISEVVMPDKRNQNIIYKNATLLLNGKRFELMRGDDHLGLEVSYKMFSPDSKWRYVDEHGKSTDVPILARRQLSHDLRNYADQVRDEWTGRTDKSKYSLEEYAMKRMSKLIELFEKEYIRNNPAMQEALVANMLSPSIDKNVTAYTPFKGAVGPGAKFGPKFIENRHSKVIYHFLSQVANQSLKDAPMSKSTAERILENITTLKKMGHYDIMTKGANDIHMRQRSMNHPSDLSFGHIAKDAEIGIGVFEALSHESANARKAAEIMIEYFSGDRLLDSATLYKASKILEQAGVPVDRQMVTTNFETDTGKTYNTEILTTNSLRTSDTRNYGTGGTVKESVPSFVKKAFKCYTK